MYSIDKEKQTAASKPKEVDIHPLGKWKRILMYLGDMMFSFILCFVLFNVAVFPLSTLIYPIDGERSVDASRNRDDILYGQELLFYREEVSPRYDFVSNLKYTYNRFISYYVFESPTPVDSNFPEYCHIEENEVFAKYYKSIRSDSITYKSLFSKYSKFFDTEGDNISLVQSVKDNIRFYFDPSERLESDDYKALSEVFAAQYGSMIKNIMANDISFKVGGAMTSYIESQKIVDDIATKISWRVSIGVLISFLIATFVVHILYPLINKYNHTPLMSIMHIERVGSNNLKSISKVETAFTGIYSLLFDLVYVFFVPFLNTSFLNLFDLPLTFVLSLFSFFSLIVSLVIMLVHPYNRGGSDLLSRTVLIPSDDMDAVERARNYGK